MLDDALRPTLVNLGLAKYVGLDEADATRVGIIVGTPAYAAPEQIAGESVDIRADLFSLALILVELLAGHRVRQQGSVETMMRHARRAEIDVDALPFSRLLRDALGMALELRPDHRFKGAAQMLDALIATPEYQG
jgi:serine/threonine protein kinase